MSKLILKKMKRLHLGAGKMYFEGIKYDPEQVPQEAMHYFQEIEEQEAGTNIPGSNAQEGDNVNTQDDKDSEDQTDAEDMFIYSKSELRAAKKEGQEEILIKLGLNPEEYNNEDERVNAILKVQE